MDIISNQPSTTKKCFVCKLEVNCNQAILLAKALQDDSVMTAFESHIINLDLETIQSSVICDVCQLKISSNNSADLFDFKDHIIKTEDKEFLSRLNTPAATKKSKNKNLTPSCSALEENAENSKSTRPLENSIDEAISIPIIDLVDDDNELGQTGNSDRNIELDNEELHSEHCNNSDLVDDNELRQTGNSDRNIELDNEELHSEHCNNTVKRTRENRNNEIVPQYVIDFDNCGLEETTNINEHTQPENDELHTLNYTSVERTEISRVDVIRKHIDLMDRGSDTDSIVARNEISQKDLSSPQTRIFVDPTEILDKKRNSMSQTGIRIYKCRKCSFQTKYKSKLRNHYLFHNKLQIIRNAINDHSHVTNLKSSYEIYSSLDKKKSHKYLIFAFKSIKQNLNVKKQGSVMFPKQNSIPTKVETKSGRVIDFDTVKKKKLKKCPKCSYSTWHKYSLLRHLLRHENQNKPLLRPNNNDTIAQLEGESIAQLAAVVQENVKVGNINEHHEGNNGLSPKNKPEHKCPQCTYMAINKYCLLRHLLCHENENKQVIYKCRNCSYRTKYRFNFNKHSLIHNRKNNQLEEKTQQMNEFKSNLHEVCEETEKKTVRAISEKGNLTQKKQTLLKTHRNAPDTCEYREMKNLLRLLTHERDNNLQDKKTPQMNGFKPKLHEVSQENEKNTVRINSDEGTLTQKKQTLLKRIGNARETCGYRVIKSLPRSLTPEQDYNHQDKKMNRVKPKLQEVCQENGKKTVRTMSEEQNFTQKRPTLLKTNVSAPETCEYQEIKSLRPLKKLEQRRKERSLYKCTHCKYQTKYNSTFKIHFLKHQNEGEIEVFQCDKCSYKTKYKGNLKLHIYKWHNKRKKNTFLKTRKKKPLASDQATKPDHVRIGFKTNKKPIEKKCPKCTYSTLYKYSFIQHLLCHENKSKLVIYKCIDCSYRTKYKGNFKKHLLSRKHNNTKNNKIRENQLMKTIQISKENLSQKNQTLNKPVKTLSSFKNVEQLREKSTLYKCNLCNYQTKHKNTLKQHFLKHQSEEEAVMFQCNTCPYKSKYKGNLKVHLSHHGNENEKAIYKCFHCLYKTILKSNLTRHLLIHRDINEKSIQESAEMNKINLDSATHKKQKTLQNNENEFDISGHQEKTEVLTTKIPKGQNKNAPLHKSTHCAYKSKLKATLKIHSLVHKRENEVQIFQCNKCAYQSKCKFNLNKHLLRHINALNRKLKSSKPEALKCPQCTFSTQHKYSLTQHLLCHENKLVTYKCQNCSYRTRFRCNLNRHMLTHINESNIKENTSLQILKINIEKSVKCNVEPQLIAHQNEKNTKDENPPKKQTVQKNVNEICEQQKINKGKKQTVQKNVNLICEQQKINKGMLTIYSEHKNGKQIETLTHKSKSNIEENTTLKNPKMNIEKSKAMPRQVEKNIQNENPSFKKQTVQKNVNQICEQEINKGKLKICSSQHKDGKHIVTVKPKNKSDIEETTTLKSPKIDIENSKAYVKCNLEPPSMVHQIEKHTQYEMNKGIHSFQHKNKINIKENKTFKSPKINIVNSKTNVICNSEPQIKALQMEKTTQDENPPNKKQSLVQKNVNGINKQQEINKIKLKGSSSEHKNKSNIEENTTLENPKMNIEKNIAYVECNSEPQLMAHQIEENTQDENSPCKKQTLAEKNVNEMSEKQEINEGELKRSSSEQKNGRLTETLTDKNKSNIKENTTLENTEMNIEKSKAYVKWNSEPQLMAHQIDKNIQGEHPSCKKQELQEIKKSLLSKISEHQKPDCCKHSDCTYKTKFKGDLKMHSFQHKNGKQSETLSHKNKSNSEKSTTLKSLKINIEMSKAYVKCNLEPQLMAHRIEKTTQDVNPPDKKQTLVQKNVNEISDQQDINKGKLKIHSCEYKNERYTETLTHENKINIEENTTLVNSNMNIEKSKIYVKCNSKLQLMTYQIQKDTQDESPPSKKEIVQKNLNEINEQQEINKGKLKTCSSEDKNERHTETSTDKNKSNIEENKTLENPVMNIETEQKNGNQISKQEINKGKLKICFSQDKNGKHIITVKPKNKSNIEETTTLKSPKIDIEKSKEYVKCNLEPQSMVHQIEKHTQYEINKGIHSFQHKNGMHIDTLTHKNKINIKETKTFKSPKINMVNSKANVICNSEPQIKALQIEKTTQDENPPNKKQSLVQKNVNGISEQQEINKIKLQGRSSEHKNKSNIEENTTLENPKMNVEKSIAYVKCNSDPQLMAHQIEKNTQDENSPCQKQTLVEKNVNEMSEQQEINEGKLKRCSSEQKNGRHTEALTDKNKNNIKGNTTLENTEMNIEKSKAYVKWNSEPQLMANQIEKNIQGEHPSCKKQELQEIKKSLLSKISEQQKPDCYKCSDCTYKTKFKGNLKMHSFQHKNGKHSDTLSHKNKTNSEKSTSLKINIEMRKANVKCNLEPQLLAHQIEKTTQDENPPDKKQTLVQKNVNEISDQQDINKGKLKIHSCEYKNERYTETLTHKNKINIKENKTLKSPKINIVNSKTNVICNSEPQIKPLQIEKTTQDENAPNKKQSLVQKYVNGISEQLEINKIKFKGSSSEHKNKSNIEENTTLENPKMNIEKNIAYVGSNSEPQLMAHQIEKNTQDENSPCKKQTLAEKNVNEMSEQQEINEGELKRSSSEQKNGRHTETLTDKNKSNIKENTTLENTEMNIEKSKAYVKWNSEPQLVAHQIEKNIQGEHPSFKKQELQEVKKSLLSKISKHQKPDCYKCSDCTYKTKFKGDLKMHSFQQKNGKHSETLSHKNKSNIEKSTTLKSLKINIEMSKANVKCNLEPQLMAHQIEKTTQDENPPDKKQTLVQKNVNEISDQQDINKGKLKIHSLTHKNKINIEENTTLVNSNMNIEKSKIYVKCNSKPQLMTYQIQKDIQDESPPSKKEIVQKNVNEINEQQEINKGKLKTCSSEDKNERHTETSTDKNKSNIEENTTLENPVMNIEKSKAYVKCNSEPQLMAQQIEKNAQDENPPYNKETGQKYVDEINESQEIIKGKLKIHSSEHKNGRHPETSLNKNKSNIEGNTTLETPKINIEKSKAYVKCSSDPQLMVHQIEQNTQDDNPPCKKHTLLKKIINEISEQQELNKGKLHRHSFQHKNENHTQTLTHKNKSNIEGNTTLERHQMSIKNRKAYLKCDLKSQLMALQIEKNTQIENPPCKKQEPQEINESLLPKILEVQKPNWYTCSECTYKTKFKGNLKLHSFQHKNGKHSGTFSLKNKSNSEISTTLKSLKVNIEKSKSNVKCYLEPQLMAHQIESNTQDENPPFKKQALLQTNVNEVSEQQEINLLHPKMPKQQKKTVWYKCSDCIFQTKTKAYLKLHCLQHKKREHTRLFQCHKCSYVSNNISYFKQHLFRHTDEYKAKVKQSRQNALKCLKCGLSTSKCTSNKHLLIHIPKNNINDKSQLVTCVDQNQKILMYKCKECSYKNKKKGLLNRHLLVHKQSNEVQMFSCPKCPLKSKYKTAIKKHFLTHKGENEVEIFACQECSYKSRYRQAFNRHCKTHKSKHEVEMFECPECSHKTKYKYNLKEHILLMHNKCNHLFHNTQK